jgi:beta-glucosidase
MVLKKPLQFAFLCCALPAVIGPFAGAQTGVFSDQAKQKAEALLTQMTLEEKVGQLNQMAGADLPGLGGGKPDELIGQGKVGSILWLTDVKEINRLQHLAIEKTRLHIPILFGFDVIHGYRTVFPVPLAMASSWDPSVEEQAQHLAAQDARAAGIQWTFTPMVDIARDARWGRIVEGAGEDPYLGAAMARAQVRGFLRYASWPRQRARLREAFCRLRCSRWGPRLRLVVCTGRTDGKRVSGSVPCRG